MGYMDGMDGNNDGLSYKDNISYLQGLADGIGDRQLDEEAKKEILTNLRPYS